MSNTRLDDLLRAHRLDVLSYQWAYQNGQTRQHLLRDNAAKDCPFRDSRYQDAYWDGYDNRPPRIWATV